MNFIEAIKKVRALGYGTFEVVRDETTGKSEIVNRITSLKDAKNLVEDIMALGVQRYLDDQAAEQATKRAATVRHRFNQMTPVVTVPADEFVEVEPLDDDIPF